MGTSNLNKGPKGSSLLPSDYDGEALSGAGIYPSDDEPQDNPEKEPQDNPEEDPQNNPEVQKPALQKTWTTAKKTFGSQIGRTNPHVGHIGKSYVRALGGHKRAAGSVPSARKITSDIIYLFSGAPSDVKRKLTELGISYEGKTTKEVFNDIFRILRTGAGTNEETIADSALGDTINDLLESDLYSEDLDETLNKGLLDFLVANYLKNSIFKKLLTELAYAELTIYKTYDEIQSLEDNLMEYISGICKTIVSGKLHDNVNETEIKNLSNILYETCYKVMEGMK